MLLPNCIETITEGMYQPQDFAMVTRLVIAPSVVEIGRKAFDGWKNLTEVVFMTNGHLQKIGARAFADTSLQSLKLPPTLVEIDASAFRSCV